MNLSIKWLNDFVDTTGIGAKDYCDKMTLTGSKVEGFEELASDITGVVVGRLLSVDKHPNADKLQICKVDVGKDAPIQVVTGAQNVFAGAVVPVATDNSTLPGGVKIRSGSLRGELSEGMLCSIAELGLTTHDMPGAAEDGILILDDSFKIGENIVDALMLADTSVEFEITSNRPDCLSVIGLARESAVSFGRELRLRDPAVNFAKDDDSIEKYISVGIEDAELCRRYAARVIKNVKIAPSPLWLRMRLRASGVRPINNIVDITNYVMLEYGQPMHAFDYACLDGAEIRVRRAAAGEKFVSLDSEEHTLSDSMLVIADKTRAVALAGVMGGENSEIKDTTATVVFESANFKGPSVRVTAKKLGMRTESSARFEKGLDAENVMPALDRACELVEMLGAGEVVHGTTDVYPGREAPYTMPLGADKINAFLGTDIEKNEMIRILEELGFAVKGDTITVPSWRADVRCMNDVAEEIARIHGYDKIAETMIAGETTQGGRTERQQFELDLHGVLCDMGLYEAETFSFISPKYYDKINMPADDARRKSVVITNPLGEDTGIMRTTALPSMLEVLARNYNYSNDKAALYESATVYIPRAEGELPDERRVITIGFYNAGDFYTLKGMTEKLLSAARTKTPRFEAKSDSPTFHPGRCATVTVDGNYIGVIGQIHPDVCRNYGFDDKCAVFAAEIDFSALFDARGSEPEYKHLPKFPASWRDFSFVCDESLEVGKIEDALRASGVKLLEDVKLFDIYRGIQVGAGKKSVSYRVSLRASDRTLTDDEADKAAAKLLRVLADKLGISIRE